MTKTYPDLVQREEARERAIFDDSCFANGTELEHQLSHHVRWHWYASMVVLTGIYLANNIDSRHDADCLCYTKDSCFNVSTVEV
jgi:hypothetical protein